MVGVSSLLIIIYYLGRNVESTADYKKACISLSYLVDCANKKLDDIPKNIPEWTDSLNLNNNSIHSLKGEAWKNLTQLVQLKLNKNKIQKIHKETFENMHRLTLLELNRNQIEEIEALSFKPLEQVIFLKLRRNRIKNLSDGTFFGLKKIKVLLLDYNYVQVITKSWLYNLENLKELSISNNDIHTIDNDAWEFCKGLIELNLSYNRLKYIKRDTFKDLVDLQKLSLNNNNITFIEENAFSNTPYLQVLNLTNNRISYTIEDANGVFRSLTVLKKFSIASNDIKSINKYAFSGLNEVTHLDLDNNNITSIQMNAFSEMPYLNELAINTTSLLCDCNLEWFYEYLKLKRLNVTTVCTYPDWLRGISLSDVPANNFTCDDLPKPRLIEEPGVEIMALKGGDISLACRAMSSSSSKMTFLWKKDNVDMHHAGVTIVTMIDSKTTESISYLNITKIQHSNAGKYQCVVSNSFGTTYSKKSNISVLIYPKFIKIPSNITVQAGTTAKLVCLASGEPPPEVAWQKDGGNDFPAARERRMQVMPADDVFFIMNTKPSDMGVYSCIARNTAGKIVANATLNIEEKPSFVRPMEDKEVTAGESVVIQCMASGAPKPTIQWLKDGIPITATERHFFTAEDQLMIIVDTILNDGGIYTCKLNNSLGTETGYSTIIVKPVLTPYSDMLGIIIITVVSCAVLTSGIWVVIIYHTRRRMGPGNSLKSPQDPLTFDLTEKMVNQFGDNTSEHSSCKDSGTGDSAKRSNDDLLPGDEYTLIINDGNPVDKATTMRTASLIYLPAEGKNVHTPLLHESSPSYSRSTNHDRLSNKEIVDEIDINAITPADEVKE